MRWDESVRYVLPAAVGDRVIADMRVRWAGARVYVTMSAARLDWTRSRGPVGSAETWAAELNAAVCAAGGTEAQTRDILLPLAGSYVFVR